MIPKQKQVINKNDISNKNLKVKILGKEEDGSGVKFNIKLWEKVKAILEKDGYQITETVIKNPNYNNEIKNFKNEGFDMVVGFISIIYSRSKFGNYTVPIILDQFVIGFEPKDLYENTFWYQVLRNIGTILLIFSFLVVIFSLGLYFYGNHYKKKGARMRWHFFGVMAALLGEPGSIVESIDIRNNYSVIITFFILLAMFVLSLLLEAALTQQIVEDDIDAEDDPIGTDIKGMKLMAEKGSSFINAIKNKGGIPIPVKTGYNKIQDHYLKNKTQAAGYVTEASSWGELKQTGKYPTLVKSKFQFPYDEAGWIVDVQNNVLLDKINQILIKYREDKTIKKLCAEIMPHMDTMNCGI